MKNLRRSRTNRIIGGVCGGVGEYLKVDPVAIRVIWAITFLAGTVGFWIYLIAWLLIPKE